MRAAPYRQHCIQDRRLHAAHTIFSRMLHVRLARRMGRKDVLDAIGTVHCCKGDISTELNSQARTTLQTERAVQEEVPP